MKKITLAILLCLISTVTVFSQQTGNTDIQNSDVLTFSIAEINNSANINNGISNNNDFFIVENNGADLEYTHTPISVNLSENSSTSITTDVSFSIIERVWKIIGISDNIIPAVTIQIPESSIINSTTAGNYYMFISDSGNFDASSDFIPMTLDDNGNLSTKYNLEGTTYITFGFAPLSSFKRSIYFNGIEDYIDMRNALHLNPNGFSLSAWVNQDENSNQRVSIISKRDSNFSEGYDLSLTSDNKVAMQWNNGSHQTLISHTSIPNGEWHHIAVTYNGVSLSIYIDGVLDKSANLSAPLQSNDNFLIAAAGNDSPTQFFKGYIDEVRVWKTCLTVDQLRFMMNQEIFNYNGIVTGKELPITVTKNDISNILWSDLVGYYPMSSFAYRNTIDASGNGNHGQLKHVLSVTSETTPIPYKSSQEGDWNNKSTWTNGEMQYIPGSTSIVNPDITIDWNIVRTTHNITLDNTVLPTINNNNRTILGLINEANELKVLGETTTQTGNAITVTHYLNLQGTLDLEGESQLIQTVNSDLNVGYYGKIERDQQGTSDMFTYNYWSSPVTKQSTEVNSYKISDVLMDGTNNSDPLSINFSSSGFNGAPTYPIKIADYWIWKYANQPSQNYSSWQHIRRTGTLYPGEGFTMKGPGMVSDNTIQNYVFSGKPNNGDIAINLTANNEYLVGNPYPSAIDADIFIRDNGYGLDDTNGSPVISGTLYFWNHYSGNSHILHEYQGGYASYNYSGAVPAAIKVNEFDSFNSYQLLNQKPGRFIPVAQGFFVLGQSDGLINFNNGQRVFKKEGEDSQFIGSHSINNEELIDDRMKYRIVFNSVNTIRRQLLLTIDENTSTSVDWAYDGKLNDSQIDDMFWLIDNQEYIIQASNDTSAVYPFGIKTTSDGLNSISIDDLENVPSDVNIYIHDSELNIYHDLRQSTYEIFLVAGDYRNRFAITFSTNSDSLSIDENTRDSLTLLYSNEIDKIVLVNPNKINVKTMTLYNTVGQQVSTFNNITNSGHSEYNVKNLSSGAYIVKLITANNFVLTKKIVVN